MSMAGIHGQYMRFDRNEDQHVVYTRTCFLDGTVRSRVNDCGIENKTDSQGRGVISLICQVPNGKPPHLWQCPYWAKRIEPVVKRRYCTI
jgi:hypothetical protein